MAEMLGDRGLAEDPGATGAASSSITAAPTEGAAAPTEGAAAPAEGAAAPTEGAAAPTEGAASPTEGAAAPEDSGVPDVLSQLRSNVVRISGVGDAEVRALAEEFPTFSVVVRPGLAVVFHASQSTVKKNEVFHAAETSAAAEDIGKARSHVILVLRNKNTATVKSLMSEAASRGARLEIFSLVELQYNPARHHLVPRHAKVAKAAEQSVLSRYKLQNRFQLPLILQGDAMARYLGLQHGDLVRVDRPSPTAGSAVIYRVCA